MKKSRRYYFVIVALLIIALLPVSCIKDNFPRGENASVTMTFTTRAQSANTSADDKTLLEKEQMQTLRVIVARANTNEILYNELYQISPEETSKTITFNELTVNENGEDFKFYAIANESGVNYGNWKDITIEQLNNLQMPEVSALNNQAIPQTAYRLINVKPQTNGGIQSENMKLDFVVAKICLTINNTSNAVQTVENIHLTGVNTLSTPLFFFADESQLSSEKQGDVNLGSVTVLENASQTVYAYFYENTGGDYKLTADWKNTEQILEINKAVTPNITEIKRGTELDITIKLNASIKIEDLLIQVNPWGNEVIDVPEFN